jgi:pimeloyl-ACP methyl ester carboxylesterase
MMPHSTSNTSDNALEFLCSIRFHRVFTYTLNNTTHRVSYSNYGSPSSSAVVLFFGGLLGGRLSYTPLDTVARRHNIRIIHADRPGIGATTPVCVKDRIPAYLAMLPKLLAHLGIEHVSVAAHSFGTVYAINFLLLYPESLHPERPYVAFWAPWVSPGHSGVRHLQAAGLLPASVIGKFSGLASFVNGSVMPVLGMSSGLSSAVTGGLRSSNSVRDAADVLPAASSGDNGALSETDGVALDLDDPAVVKQLRNILPTFLFAESIDGAGQDAQLCLRKPRSIPWSTPAQHWEDIDDAVRQLNSTIAAETPLGRRWTVDTFHAETDVMVGEKGQIWFDGCWQSDRTGASEGDGIMYRSHVVGGSDHDFILDPVFGISERWFQWVAGAFDAHISATAVEGCSRVD